MQAAQDALLVWEYLAEHLLCFAVSGHGNDMSKLAAGFQAGGVVRAEAADCFQAGTGKPFRCGVVPAAPQRSTDHGGSIDEGSEIVLT
jgi:hypothetical protein